MKGMSPPLNDPFSWCERDYVTVGV